MNERIDCTSCKWLANCPDAPLKKKEWTFHCWLEVKLRKLRNDGEEHDSQ